MGRRGDDDGAQRRERAAGPGARASRARGRRGRRSEGGGGARQVLCETAKRLGLPPPASMQNDYSILNRRIEENGVSEASRRRPARTPGHR